MFNEKTVWITGASSGIGEALAIALAKQNASLILSARNEKKLQAVRDKCLSVYSLKAKTNSEEVADRILVLPLDVTDETSLNAKTEQAKVFTGRLDLLINNAGISQRSTCVNTTMQTYRTLFEVDVFGQIALTKLVLPIMIEQGSGHIAVTASVAGKIGVPFRTGYCAAKHAVMGFFDALRAEVAHHNIAVSTITPGFIRTDISENALRGDGQAFGAVDRDIKGGMEADDCAQVILKVLGKQVPEIAVGKGMEMHTPWLKRYLPKMLFKIMQKEYLKRSAMAEFK